MKVELTANGLLRIVAESDVEFYALTHWCATFRKEFMRDPGQDTTAEIHIVYQRGSGQGGYGAKIHNHEVLAA